MQNQGIISYIFPHFGLKAQPLKKPVFMTGFFVFEICGQIFVWGCLFSCEQRVCGEMPELELFEQSKN